MDETINIINITEGKPLYKTRKIDSLKDMLKQSGSLYGDHIAFQFRKEPHAPKESRTYSKFVREVDSFGSALFKLGLSGSHIAIIGENRYEWVVAFLASVNGAGVAVPLDKALPVNEIELLLERGEIEVLIYSDSFKEAVEKIAKNNTRLKAMICMNPENPDEMNRLGFYSFSGLLEKGEKLLESGYREYTDKEIDPDEMAALIFTSGTSSASKAVMLSHRNICSDIISLAGVVNFERGESVLSMLPLSHTFENTAGLLYELYKGMTISISDGLKYLSKNLTEYQPDLIIAVPLILDKFRSRVIDEIKKKGMYRKVNALMHVANILSHIGLDIRRKLFKKLLEPFGGKLRVIVTGGAGMEARSIKWYESIGIKVYQGYGLTETSPVVSGGNDRRRSTETCGEPLPGVKIAVADPDFKGSGELVIRGGNVMLGYWKNKDATEEALRDGWFHTGDLGFIDKKGFIHVTGRIKSMIVLNNGKKVFPEELEAYINKLRYVKESLVWGETSSDGTVEICSKIVLDKEQIESMQASPDDESAIRRILDPAIKDINKMMPSFKAIRYYVYSYDELIKTTSMKIKRYVETDQIRSLLYHKATNIKNAAGENIDKLKEMLAKRAENY